MKRPTFNKPNKKLSNLAVKKEVCFIKECTCKEDPESGKLIFWGIYKHPKS